MSHEVNGITADPLAKVANVLTSHFACAEALGHRCACS
jgi:hypothetical protein